MDSTSLKIEGITRSIFNLEETKKMLGNRRLIHVSTQQEDGKKLYYSYEMKTINKTTVNLRCTQRNEKIGHKKKGQIRLDGKEHRIEKEPRAQCSAVLTCSVAFPIVEKVTDGKNEKKSRTKSWTFSDKVTDEQFTNPKNYELYHNCTKACATKGCLSRHTCVPHAVSAVKKRDFRAYIRRQVAEDPTSSESAEKIYKAALKQKRFQLKKTRPSRFQIYKDRSIRSIQRTKLLFDNEEYDWFKIEDNVGGPDEDSVEFQFYYKYKGMQIFTIAERLGLMNRYPCYLDGTFKLVCNLNYAQVFIISVKREDKDGEMVSFPLAYAFMPNRQKKTYDDLFFFLSKLYIDETGNELTPFRCTLDFERASINSVLYMWPQTSVRLCSIHLTRNLRKKLQSLFGNFYEDPELYKLWQTLKSIHLVDWNEDLIQTYFNYLRTFKPKKKMIEFTEYLESTYFKFRLGNGSFDPYSYRYWSWGQDIKTYENVRRIS